MQITLPRELEQFIHERVKAGNYGSPSDVVRDGLNLLREREEDDHRRDAVLRAKLTASLDESDRGETVPFDESTLEEIRAEGRKQIQEARGSRK